MAQHECVFDFSLLGQAKLPPHDACRCDASARPYMYTLHWYQRLCCVIQEGGQVLMFNPDAQLHFSSLKEALPSMIWILTTNDAPEDASHAVQQ